MIDKIKERWNALPPDRKKTVVISSVVGVVIIFSVATYYLTRQGENIVPQKAVSAKKEISLEPKLLEKSYIAETTKQLDMFRREFEDIKKQIEEEKSIKETKEVENAKQKTLENKTNIPPMPPAPLHSVLNGQPSTIPPPPQLNTQQSTQAVTDKQPMVEALGDIEVVSYQVKVQTKAEEKAEDKKKEGEKVYLPPSFMEATLLSGLDAPAVGEGKGNPVPVLLRVKDIAVLPNKVKANLKGCFVIADGVGSLADERAHLRLVSLSCIAKNGEAIIDQEVKGYVVDSDGKIGLRGRVVSKMGSAIARSFLAGLFSGLGQAVQQSTMTSSISALGTTQTGSTEFSNIAKAGVGSGIATAAQEIQKFYLELARQAIPVIEVGATRTVTLVISKGTHLEIKDYRGIGGK